MTRRILALLGVLAICGSCAQRRATVQPGPSLNEVRVTHWECKTGADRGIVECFYVLEGGGVEYRRLRIVDGR